MVTWEPYFFTDQKANPFPLQAIAAGRFDDYLRRQGQQFAAFQRPLVIRLAHEMNGDWYPWGQGVNGNTPDDYVAAFRHVHEVVTAAGATNVVWLWAPNFLNGISAATPLASLYPGSDVVDWVGADGYYGDPHDTFPTKFATTMDQLDVVAPGKPVVLAEVAVARTPDRTAQIEELVGALAAEPRVVGFVWSEFADPNVSDWRVGDDPAAAAALGRAVRAGGFDAAPQQVP
jgi:beta-mannanase